MRRKEKCLTLTFTYFCVCEFNVIMIERAILLPQDYVTNTKFQESKMSVLVIGSKRLSKLKKLFVIGCLSEVENMALLLKTPYNSDTELGRI